MKKPGDPNPDPPGGRAAERLQEFIEQRRPQPPKPDDTAEQPASDAHPDAGAPGGAEPSS